MARPPRRSELFVVGLNIDKHEKYFGTKSGKLVNLTHGVSLRADVDPVEAFRTYGFRIASIKFKDAAITHSCAWTLAPVETSSGQRGQSRRLQYLDVFIGGSYHSVPAIMGRDLTGPGDPTLRIIQSLASSDHDDPLLYEQHTFTDPLGSFTMYVATTELMALQQFEASKQHKGKRVPVSEHPAIARALLERHDGDPYAVLAVVDEIANRLPAPVHPYNAKKGGKEARVSMFERFTRTMLPLMRQTVAETG